MLPSVASAKRMAGRPDCPLKLCGWVVKVGLVHCPAMLTLNASLCAEPHGLRISTQYVLAVVSGGVVKVAEVAPETGLVRSSFCPSYH